MMLTCNRGPFDAEFNGVEFFSLTSKIAEILPFQ